MVSGTLAASRVLVCGKGVDWSCHCCRRGADRGWFLWIILMEEDGLGKKGREEIKSG